jgi:hypothetical protein
MMLKSLATPRDFLRRMAFVLSYGIADAKPWTPPMRVFGYSRVSTAEQSAHGDSLETQRQQIVGYAMMKGWQVAEIFVERGMRFGRTPNRAMRLGPARGDRDSPRTQG